MVDYDQDIRTIEGILMRVSSPKSFVDGGGRVKEEYFNLGIKTDDGNRILIYLGTSIMGWSGNLNRSKIWYFDRNNPKRGVRQMSLKDPERYIHKRFKIKGAYHTINKETKKYRMNRIKSIVIFLDS